MEILVKNPKLEAGDYADLVKALKKASIVYHSDTLIQCICKDMQLEYFKSVFDLLLINAVCDYDSNPHP